MSSTKNNNSSGKIPAIAEPEKDQFQSFAKDPRLQNQTAQPRSQQSPNSFLKPLKNKIDQAADEQDAFNLYRVFKKQQIETIIKLEDKPFENRKAILQKLTELAEAIIQVSFENVLTTMKREFGIATHLSSSKQTEESHMCILGMGSLGAKVLNYHSDLDTIFIYSFLGETHGKKQMSNREYFSKFTQKWMHLLSILTESGKCYDIDFELRPLGQAGTLVTTFDHFISHQMQAQNWEHMALLRARPVAGEPHLQTQIANHLHTLAFKRPVAADFFTNMHDIRKKVVSEKTKPSKTSLNLKWSAGTLMDVDFILHGLQLKNQIVYPSLTLRNPYDLAAALHKQNLISKEEETQILSALNLYHTLIAKLHLQKRRSENMIHFESESFEKIAEDLKKKPKDLQDDIFSLSKDIHSLYKQIYEIS